VPLIERLAFTRLDHAFELKPAAFERYRVC
jgi:hypothetical protein